MRVLVTGGTGVIGEGAILELLKAGHTVRLLSRGADEGVREWPEGVEPFVADVTERETLRGAADGCGAVLHVTGIVEEDPPEVTFDRVNVDGTRNILDEAERGKVGRFVFVSSLGAERGQSGYHASKREAETLVRASSLEWVVLRPGNVFGPGDSVLSTYLKMFRTLPAVPIIGAGDQPFQPIWYKDLAKAAAAAVDAPGIGRRTLELGGGEITTMNEIANRFEQITDRHPVRVPVPETIASLGVDLAGMVGVKLPLNEAMLKMLVEENVVRDPDGNALVTVFHVEPTPLAEALVELANAIPEQLPREGVGSLEQKRFFADIEGSPLTARTLLDLFRDQMDKIMPIETKAEPVAEEEVVRGATLTLNIPGRGNVQVRVLQSDNHVVTFGTVEGHPLAGVVNFHAEQHGKKILFEVETITRSGSVLDYVAMTAGGSLLQEINWTEVVEQVVERSGGTAPAGVKIETRAVDEEEARVLEEKIFEQVASLKRERREAELRQS
jgi:uncharacterized protein YbjT (DUF2867 family)